LSFPPTLTPGVWGSGPQASPSTLWSFFPLETSDSHRIISSRLLRLFHHAYPSLSVPAALTTYVVLRFPFLPISKFPTYVGNLIHISLIGVPYHDWTPSFFSSLLMVISECSSPFTGKRHYFNPPPFILRLDFFPHVVTLSFQIKNLQYFPQFRKNSNFCRLPLVNRPSPSCSFLRVPLSPLR